MSSSDVLATLRSTFILFGFVVIGFAVWLLVSIGSGPAEGDGFGAGFAVLSAFFVGTLGLAIVAIALVTMPGDGGDTIVPSVEGRPRQVAGAGLASIAGSLVVPVVVYGSLGMSAALFAWTALVILGVALVSATVVWTVGEAALAWARTAS